MKDLTTNNVLLVFGKKSQKWGFPKGHMEMGETEEETALRELREETGIRLDNPLDTRIRFRNNVYFLVSISKENLTHTTIEDKEEIEKMCWFSYMDICKLPEYQCNFGLKHWIKKIRTAVDMNK
jgi:tRNA nucleotidyltransferase (CCA-adding enzyme)